MILKKKNKIKEFSIWGNENRKIPNRKVIASTQISLKKNDLNHISIKNIIELKDFEGNKIKVIIEC